MNSADGRGNGDGNRTFVILLPIAIATTRRRIAAPTQSLIFAGACCAAKALGQANGTWKDLEAPDDQP